MDYSIIQFVDELLQNAVTKLSSDIHIEPYNQFYKIRLRIDGILSNHLRMDFEFALRVISRIKVLANIDIAQNRLPQDGSFTYQINKDLVYCRVNTILTVNGEKIVLRLLNPDKAKIVPLDKLGLNSDDLYLIKKHIQLTQGLILITGPTGSGKTTSLYAMLNELNTEARNIISIEEPVEIKLAGINQIATNNKINLTFANILKSILRQDPDVIMLGEIRDKETATTALNAAQTGHLVLATMHTLSALEIFTRFNALEIPLINVLSSLKLVIAQRLLRKVCKNCHGESCEDCNQGYKGRFGVFNLMMLDQHLREHFFSFKNAEEIIKNVKEYNFSSLYEQGMQAYKNNQTTLKEVHRVLGYE